MIDTEKIDLILEYAIRGYLFGMGEASPEELKGDLKKILPEQSSKYVDEQFGKILERYLKDTGYKHPLEE